MKTSNKFSAFSWYTCNEQISIHLSSRIRYSKISHLKTIVLEGPDYSSGVFKDSMLIMYYNIVNDQPIVKNYQILTSDIKILDQLSFVDICRLSYYMLIRNVNVFILKIYHSSEIGIWNFVLSHFVLLLPTVIKRVIHIYSRNALGRVYLAASYTLKLLY